MKHIFRNNTRLFLGIGCKTSTFKPDSADMPLSDISCKNAKPKEKQYRLADSKGLGLIVRPGGSKLWRFRYLYGDKEKEISFGGYPEVSLKEARERQEVARRQLRDDIDPGYYTDKKIFLLNIEIVIPIMKYRNI